MAMTHETVYLKFLKLPADERVVLLRKLCKDFCRDCGASALPCDCTKAGIRIVEIDMAR